MGRQSGNDHYGETIPPEYANKDRSELDKTGRVIKKTMYSLLRNCAPRSRRTQKTAEDAAGLDQQRHDKALLNTFSNVQELNYPSSVIYNKSPGGLMAPPHKLKWSKKFAELSTRSR